jgi:hypothetical protein
VSQGDLPAVADQQVQPEGGDGVDQHQRELPVDDPVGVEGDAHRDQHDHHQGRDAQRLPAASVRLDPEERHVRLTSGEPNSPDGRTSSTTKMTASGTSTFRSAPTALT